MSLINTVGRYDKRLGMKRWSGRKCFCGFSGKFKPWKERWHFFAYKDEGRWQRGLAGLNFPKHSTLSRSGQERVFMDSRVRGRRSLIHHPAIFHPKKHRVDCSIYVRDDGDDHYEFGISFDLDEGYNIDYLENWAVCHEDTRGRWSCADCWETGDPQAEMGYVKAMFDSKQTLLLDHLEPIVKHIRYLCTHGFVDVFLDEPEDVGNSSSAVKLSCNASQNPCWFRIPVGKIEMIAPSAPVSDTAQWLHERLAAELIHAKHRGLTGGWRI